jgi:hypothetical protein
MRLSSRCARRGPFRKLVALLAAAVLVVGGAITATAVSFHYLHAAPLECACGLDWAVPHGVPRQEVQIGSHSGTEIKPAGGQRVAFEILVANWSSVTQTVLGTPHDALTSLRARLEVARVPGDVGDGRFRGYRAPPATIPPNGSIYLRYSFFAPCAEIGTTLSWDGLDLRVRVGAFTRTEYVDFVDYTFAMTPQKSAACH